LKLANCAAAVWASAQGWNAHAPLKGIETQGQQDQDNAADVDGMLMPR